jgi:hypothetical protein
VKLGNKQPLPEFNPDIKGGTSTEGVWEQGAEEDIDWGCLSTGAEEDIGTEEGWGDGWMEKIA